MPTIRDIKKLFRNDHKMSMLIDFLYRADQLRLTENELLVKIEGEWVEFSADLVAAIPDRALPQEITHAENVNKYLPPLAFKSLRVMGYNCKLSDMPVYLFPTGIIYDDKILADTKIIEQ